MVEFEEMERLSNYEAWAATVPEQITREEVWKFFGYRKALFAYDVCWQL